MDWNDWWPGSTNSREPRYRREIRAVARDPRAGRARLLVPYPSEPMTMGRARPRVAEPDNDDAAILQAVEAAGERGLL